MASFRGGLPRSRRLPEIIKWLVVLGRNLAEELRSQQRSKAISRREAHERSKVIRSRRDLRFCQKQKKRRAGLACLGIGAGLGVAAGLMIGFGAGFDTGVGIAGMFVATPAAVLLIVGLVMLAGASRMRV